MFLMTREIAHMKSFMLALESFGQIPPDPKFVNKHFNDSTGTGPHGETDSRGPWNSDGFDCEEPPALASMARAVAGRQHQRT